MTNETAVKILPENSIKGGFAILAESWAIFKQKWKKLIWLLFIFPIALMVLSAALSMSGFGVVYIFKYANFAMYLKVIFGILLVALTVFLALVIVYLSIVVNAATAYLIAEDISVKEAFNKGRKIFWKFLGWSILFGLIIGIGFLLFIIPGIILLVFLSFSLFILTLENAGPVAALKQSWGRVSGYWWTIFARFLILAIAVIILSIIANAFSSGANALFENANRGAALMILMTVIGFFVTLISFAINFVSSSISLIYNFLLYQRVKEIKEKDSQAKDNMPLSRKIGLGIIIGVIFVIVVVSFIAIVVLSLLGQLNTDNYKKQQQYYQQMNGNLSASQLEEIRKQMESINTQ